MEKPTNSYKFDTYSNKFKFKVGVDKTQFVV